MNEVFISYSSEDEGIAVLLYDTLKRMNVKAWFALYDIDYGQNYAKEIFRAIENAKIFSVLISSNSNNSDHVKNEIELATRQIKNGMIIMPIRIDKNEMDEELQYYLARRQWLDASNPPISEKMNKYCEHICAILNGNNEYKEVVNTDILIYPNCQYTNPNNNVFCGYCGKMLAVKATAEKIDDYKECALPKNSHSAEETAVEDYKKYALSGDFNKAIDLLESELKELNKLREETASKKMKVIKESKGKHPMFCAGIAPRYDSSFRAGIAKINDSSCNSFENEEESLKTIEMLHKYSEEEQKTELELCNKYNKLGFYYNRINDYAKALQYFMKAFELSSEQTKPSIHENIALTYMNMGDYNEALSNYSRALTLQRVQFGVRSRKTLLARSNALYKLGRDELALKDYNEARKQKD